MIFIASMMHTVWPAVTRVPILTYGSAPGPARPRARSTCSPAPSAEARRAPSSLWGSYAGQILVVTAVDPDHLTLLDKERNLHRGAGLQRGRLGGAGGGVAAHARIGPGDGELDEVRPLHEDPPVVVHQALARHPVLQVLELIRADDVLRQHHVVEGLLVHEVIEVAVAVGKLDRPPQEPRVGDALTGVVGALDDRPRADVLELRP